MLFEEIYALRVDPIEIGSEGTDCKIFQISDFVLINFLNLALCDAARFAKFFVQRIRKRSGQSERV